MENRLQPQWRPAPAIRLSFALHAAGAAGLLIAPGAWPWIVGALAGNHLVLAIAGLFPRSRMLGQNMLRLPAPAIARRECAITFDDGPNPEVTPAVLDILDRYRVKASFFCVGRRAAAHPELVREIARRGHSVENHSDAHSSAFGFFGPWRLRRELEAAQRTLAGLAGSPPQFFRAPMGIRSPMLDPVVCRLGLRYITWTRRGFDTVTPDPRTVLDRLTRNLAAGDILLLHDGKPLIASKSRPVVLDVLPALLERALAAGLNPVSLPMAMR
jgi:peptidoglycan-N-acetylglucosamine deacetylase